MNEWLGGVTTRTQVVGAPQESLHVGNHVLLQLLFVFCELPFPETIEVDNVHLLRHG